VLLLSNFAMNDETTRQVPHRANDIWISVTMMATLISICVGVISVNRALTDSAVTQEARFIRLEETVKSLREDLNEYRQEATRRENGRYSNGNALK
jgi:hypothetical protein